MISHNDKRRARNKANEILKAIGYKTFGRWNKSRYLNSWLKCYRRSNGFNYKLTYREGDIWKLSISKHMMFSPRSCIDIIEMDILRTVEENVDLYFMKKL